jgi:hypothetical protein
VRSQAAAETLEARGSHQLTASLLRLHAERMHITARETRLRESFTSSHPNVPVATVGAMAEDVHDLEGLRAIGSDLAGEATEPAA